MLCAFRVSLCLLLLLLYKTGDSNASHSALLRLAQSQLLLSCIRTSALNASQLLIFLKNWLVAATGGDLSLPAGAVATALVLGAGLCSFSLGRVGLSQQLMRARVVAQGATVAIMATTAAAGFGLYPSQAKE